MPLHQRNKLIYALHLQTKNNRKSKQQAITRILFYNFKQRDIVTVHKLKVKWIYPTIIDWVGPHV
jgi:hypothetical protein